MRPIRFLALSSCLLLLAACGEKPSAPGAPSEPGGATPEAQVLTGPVVRIAYEAREGEGVRLRQQMSSTMRMTMNGEEQTVPMDMRMVVVLRCASVEPGGERVLETSFEEVAMPGLPGSAPSLEGMKATTRVGPGGKVLSMEMEGVDPMLEGALKNALQGGGFNAFLPIGVEGLRAGQVIDVKDLLPVEQLEGAFAGLPGAAGGMEPDLKGAYVFKGTQEIDGQPAAEFDVRFEMTLSGGAGMSVTLKSEGTQYIDLRTGWPVGTSTIRQEMTMRSDGSGGMPGMDMRSESEIRVTAERLAK